MTEASQPETTISENKTFDKFSELVNQSVDKVHAAAREIMRENKETPLHVMALAMGICAVDAAAAIAVDENVSIESMMDFLFENMKSRVDVSMQFYRAGLEKMRQAESEAADA